MGVSILTNWISAFGNCRGVRCTCTFQFLFCFKLKFLYINNADPGVLFAYDTIWAATWQNQQKGMCVQRRLRSAWASAQSNQSCFAVRMKKAWALSCPLSALICPGWSEFSLGAQVILLVLSWCGSFTPGTSIRRLSTCCLLNSEDTWSREAQTCRRAR